MTQNVATVNDQITKEINFVDDACFLKTQGEGQHKQRTLAGLSPSFHSKTGHQQGCPSYLWNVFEALEAESDRPGWVKRRRKKVVVVKKPSGSYWVFSSRTKRYIWPIFLHHASPPSTRLSVKRRAKSSHNYAVTRAVSQECDTLSRLFQS